jgi:signal transduction histidine kinase
MVTKRFRKRIDQLFADLEKLSDNPASKTSALRQDIEELRTRLVELEKAVTSSEKRAAARKPPEPAPAPPPFAEKPAQVLQRSTPILYEKERAGYIFKEDVVLPLQGQPSEFPDAKEGVIVPLTASGQDIGKMEVQPPEERQLSPEEAALLNAVASQASLQIQNLRLLEATERARAEAESATRRFMHENWDSYLDGIRNSERIGYAYDQASVNQYIDPPEADGGIEHTVKVMDEQVGTLYVKSDPDKPMSNEDKSLVESVAQQIAQQVENIRLLADATRARAEAEEATSRLTQENWQAFTSSKENASLGFMYNSNKVLPISDTSGYLETGFTQPLTVRGQSIGQLAVAGMNNVPPEAAELTATIAERVSVHLETLRLAEELQKRAAELQTVAKLSTTVSTVLDPLELLQSVVDLTSQRFNLYHAHIYLFNDTKTDLVLTAGAGDIGRKMVAEQHAISLGSEKSLVARAAREKTAIIANDVRSNPDFLANPLLPETRAEMTIPMIVGENILGVFDFQTSKMSGFSDEDANIYTTLSAQVAVSLQNARLYVEQAETLAQLRELDRLKSSFLANMSHELRTPLNSILGFADVMIEELDGPLTENMSNDLKLIQKNGQHLLHLINDVLDMAKIEAGRMNLNPERFRVYDLLEDVTSITSPLASEKNLSLYVDETSDSQTEILADRTRLRQVMINLVNNAMKFTEQGKISLKVTRDKDMVTIAVRDTGMGIPPEKLEDIFQEFTQVDTSTTRKVGGTGLGLPISRRLIEMHGGRLWAESTGIPGEGSIFYVELPVEAKISDTVEIEKVQK